MQKQTRSRAPIPGEQAIGKVEPARVAAEEIKNLRAKREQFRKFASKDGDAPWASRFLSAAKELEDRANELARRYIEL